MHVWCVCTYLHTLRHSSIFLHHSGWHTQEAVYLLQESTALSSMIALKYSSPFLSSTVVLSPLLATYIYTSSTCLFACHLYWWWASLSPNIIIHIYLWFKKKILNNVQQQCLISSLLQNKILLPCTICQVCWTVFSPRLDSSDHCRSNKCWFSENTLFVRWRTTTEILFRILDNFNSKSTHNRFIESFTWWGFFLFFMIQLSWYKCLF